MRVIVAKHYIISYFYFQLRVLYGTIYKHILFIVYYNQKNSLEGTFHYHTGHFEFEHLDTKVFLLYLWNYSNSEEFASENMQKHEEFGLHKALYLFGKLRNTVMLITTLSYLLTPRLLNVSSILNDHPLIKKIR